MKQLSHQKSLLMITVVAFLMGCTTEEVIQEDSSPAQNQVSQNINSTPNAVESGSGDKAVESGSGDKAVESGSGDKNKTKDSGGGTGTKESSGGTGAK